MVHFRNRESELRQDVDLWTPFREMKSVPLKLMGVTLFFSLYLYLCNFSSKTLFITQTTCGLDLKS